MKKILIVVTNHATLGTTDKANGTYSPELTHALHVFTQSGMDYEIASIQGGKAPLYGTDIEGDEVNSQVLKDANFQSQINNTIPVHQLKAEDYDAIFYPGGFGLLTDLSNNANFGALAASLYEKGGLIGAVCHGPAALLAITLSSGDKLLASHTVTGFTREEELDFGTITDIPFLLEESLTRTAAQYRKVQPWQEFVVESGRVITGQNPASAHSVAKAMVNQLSN